MKEDKERYGKTMTQHPNKQPVSQRQNSEQKRGMQAWENIQAIKGLDGSQDKKLEKEYRSLARGLNAMIQINGLGQTLGFFKAKGKNDEKKPHYQLLLHLTNWMQNSDHFKASNNDVMQRGYDGMLRWITDPGTS